MIREAILKLAAKENLTYSEAEKVMDEIMDGEATPVQMSAYLTALSLKGETIDEITASAAGMRAHCIRLLHDMDVPLRYNNDKQKKPLFSRGLSVCRLLFNSFSKLKIDENYKEKRRLFY